MTKNNAWNFDTTFATGDILYASDSSTLSKLNIGSTDQVLGISGGLPQWQTADFQPSNQNFTYFEDALGSEPNLIAGMGQNSYSLFSTDGDESFATISGHPGVIELTTLTDTTSYASIVFSYAFGTGGGTLTHNAYYRIPTLSTAGNRFKIFLGYLSNDGSGAINTDGIWFEYSDNANSGNWQIKCRSASVTTTANTSTAADTDWHKYTIIVNAAGTSVAFYIDDVEVANSPITTNIPSEIGTACMITKSTGTTARTLQFDWYDQTVNLTNPRY